MAKITSFARRKAKRNKKAYFSLNMKTNSVSIAKKDIEVTDWLYINKIESKMLDVSFPFDFSRGTQQLKNKRGILTNIDGVIKAKELSKIFYKNIPENFKDISLSFFRNRIIIKGVYKIENNKIPFLLKFGIQLRDKKILFVLLEDYILGQTYKLRVDFFKELFNIPKLDNSDFFTFSVKLFPDILHNIFSINGYKLPFYNHLTFTELLIDNDFIKFKLENDIDIEKNDIPVLKETISKLALYSTKRKLFNKLKNGVTKELKEIYGDINTIHHNWVDLKFFLEFLENKFYVTEYLNAILRKEVSTDIIIDTALKYRELGEIELFIETFIMAISRLEKEKDYPLLESLYLYLAYYYKSQKSKDSIIWFEKLWSLNRGYNNVWFDFFEELIKYKNYFLAVEVGEKVAEVLDTEEESFIWQKIGYIFNNYLNNSKLALKYYSMALRLKPNSVVIKLDLIDVYIKNGRNLYAIEKLNKILESEKTSLLRSKINIKLYQLWKKEKEYERALFHIEQVLKDKRDPQLYYEASLLVRILEDPVRVNDYLNLILTHYKFYRLKEDNLYYKVIKELAIIYKEKKNPLKAYSYFIELPVSYLDINSLDELLILSKFLKKINNIFKYLELRASFFNTKNEKYIFWKEYVHFFNKISPNKEFYVKSLIRTLLNDSTDKELLIQLHSIEKYPNIEFKKIIKIYQNKFINSSEDEINRYYHNIYNIAKINNDSLISFKILEKAIKRFPDDKDFQKLYITWSNKK